MVEETKAAESGLASGTVYRRLIFLRNQQFIQTEVRLTPAPGGKHKKKKKKAEGNASTPADVDEGRLLRFDHQYLDAHHCSILVCLSLLTGQSAPVGLLVGLGGGALAMAIRRYFNSSLLTVVELDPVLIDVAKGFFGYAPDANTTNVVGDGMQYMLDCAGSCSEAAGADAPPSVPPSEAVLLDFIVLDADSADSSRGLSAPPQEFTADTAVAAMRSLLSPRGILVVNTVARDKNELRRFVDAIKEVFVPAGGDVYILKPSEDTVNLTILGVASSSAVLEKAAALFTLPGPNSGKKGKRDGAKVGSKAPTGADDLRSVVQLSVQQLLREVMLNVCHVRLH